MDSLDAQCLLIHLTEQEIPPPNLWRHERSGSLSCAYEGGERDFTWPPEAVADMACRWRDTERRPPPDSVRPFLDAHRQLGSLITSAGLGPPDAVVHDLQRKEIRVVWEEEKVAVTIDEIGERPGRPETRSGASKNGGGDSKTRGGDPTTRGGASKNGN